MSQDRVFPGVVLMLAFCLLAPLLDVAAKLAAQSGLSVGQIAAARFVVQGALMLPLSWALGLSLALSPRLMVHVFLRAGLLLVATLFFVAAIKVMPIADALAIVFVEPFLLLLLGRLLFGDEVGPRRIAASAVGFGGAMLVIQPSFEVYGPVALLPLGTALTFAFYMLLTRMMSPHMHPVTMQTHTSLAGMALGCPLLLLGPLFGFEDFDPVMPTGLGWLWLFGVGFWAAVSHMCITWALKFAPSATLAPLHYLEIVAAVGFSFAVFGDFPNLVTWAGIGVICGSGLYIIHRERIAARRRVSAATPAG